MMQKLLPVLFSVWAQFLAAQSLELVPVSPNIPWLLGAEHAGSARLYVIRQDGFVVIRESDGTMPATPFLDWSSKIKLDGEQGLLGLAFHPDYAQNGQFYIYYSQAGTGKSVLSRLHRSANNPDVADPGSEEILFSFPHPNVEHVGGCLKFGPDGYLYLTSGDGGELYDPNNNGQNNRLFLGKILRIDVDHGTPYAIPPDNPFYGSNEYLPEIWCTGLRNPWRMSFDRLSGDAWVGDVGQSMREEVDFIPAGSSGWNFGWSCSEGSLGFHACADTVCCLSEPLYEYGHNTHPNCSGCITGGYVYRGYQYDQLWGRYLFTDFCTGEINALEKSGDSIGVHSLGTYNAFDFVSFVEDFRGELYLAGYFTNKLYRIKHIDCSPVARIGKVTGNLSRCAGDTSELRLEAYGAGVSGMKFQWYLNGVKLDGDTSGTLMFHSAVQPGNFSVEVINPANGCSAFSPLVSVVIIQPSWEIVDSTLHAGQVWQGVVVQQDTSFVRQYTSALGCDSLVLYNAHVLSAAQSPENDPGVMKIVPNPAGPEIDLLLNLREASKEGLLDLFDTAGKSVFRQTLSDLPKGASRTRIRLPGLPDGMYLLTFNTGARRNAIPLVIRSNQ